MFLRNRYLILKTLLAASLLLFFSAWAFSADNELLVKFKDGASGFRPAAFKMAVLNMMPGIGGINQRFKLKQLSPVFGVPGPRGLRTSAVHAKNLKARYPRRAARAPKRFPLPDLTAIYKLSFPPTVSIAEAAEAYNALPYVEYAEPNKTFTINTVTPNDPSLGVQWALPKIQAGDAWELVTGSEQVVVAVLDTGVDYTHLDLESRIWINTGEVSANGFDDDGNGFVDDVIGWDFVDISDGSSPDPADGEDSIGRDNDPIDVHSHGTHVSGIIGAAVNNSIGIAGLDWHCRIMPVRAGYKTVAGLGSLETDDIAAGIYYAANNGADIINMSFGGDEVLQTVALALQYAYASGVVLVAAAGNEGSSVVSFPASENYTIAVGATTSSDAKASYSNTGANLDIAAPGHIIYSTMPGNAYGNKNGTSMATPYVVGLAALILSEAPSMPVQQVRHVLEVTADDLGAAGFDTQFGHGRINAYHALSSDLQAPRVVTYSVTGIIDTYLSSNAAESLSLVVTINENRSLVPTSAVTLNWQINGQYLQYVTSDITQVSGDILFQFAGLDLTPATVNVASNDRITFWIDAIDTMNNQLLSSTANPLAVLTVDDQPPQVISTPLSGQVVTAGIITVTLNFQDNLSGLADKIPDVYVLVTGNRQVVVDLDSFSNNQWLGHFYVTPNQSGDWDGRATVNIAGLIDRVGNESGIVSFNFFIDNTSPVVLGVTLNNGESISSHNTVLLEIDAVDPIAGLSEVYVSGDVYSPGWYNYSVTRDISLTTAPGTKNVLLKLRDTVGNTTTIPTLSLKLDNVLPTVNISSFTVVQTTVNGGVVLVTGNAHDEHFVSYNMFYSTDAVSWSSDGISLNRNGLVPVYDEFLATWNVSQVVSGAYWVLLEVKDIFGQVNSAVVTVDLISIGVGDVTTPAVSTILFDSIVIDTGDMVDVAPIITFITTDNNRIASWSVFIVDTDTGLVYDWASGNLNVIGLTLVTVNWIPDDITKGTYILEVKVEDGVGNLTVTASPVFEVEASFKLEEAIAAPNPYNPDNGNLYISCMLTRRSSLNLFIHALNGAIVYSDRFSAIVGYNEFVWDGRDHSGNPVANGVYLGYIRAKNEQGDIQLGVVKIAVIR
ncbi:S8 family peptidase [Candidatus Margulisiibacteriota bacterium]